ncbi:MAG TPA: hypothetical protein VHO68_02390 [Bacteroidales bacterium]|nr:hypothetical protein [Bacteroidales bacterium]
MLESVITVSITGLVAGFIFAMPIAGPISIMIVSNALKGRRDYSNQISMGAATADFAYIFIAIYGLTKLYPFYKPAIPYILIAGWKSSEAKNTPETDVPEIDTNQKK